MLTSDKEMQLVPLAIAMFPCDTHGCGHYRMRQPGRILAEQGHAVHIHEDFKFPDPEKYPYDIYHFQRITTPLGLASIRAALKTGKPVLMDLDDDLFNLFPGHPSAWYFRTGKECKRCGNSKIHPDTDKCASCGSTDLELQDRLEMCASGIREVDCITITTPELEARFKNAAKRSVIIPNYVDMNKYDSIAKKGDYNTVVGWAGSFTHNFDIGELAGAINVIEEFDDVYFAAVGANPEDIDRYFLKAFKDPNRLIKMEPLPVDDYPEILGAFDIGLAPIVDNLFNRCKSELKAEEYGAAGIPTIASNVAPYSRYISHGKDGFIVKKPKEWKKYLRKILSDKELLKEMSANAYAKALTMDIRKNIVKREMLYYQLVEEKGNKVIWDIIQEREAQNKPSLEAPFSLVGGKRG